MKAGTLISIDPSNFLYHTDFWLALAAEYWIVPIILNAHLISDGLLPWVAPAYREDYSKEVHKLLTEVRSLINSGV